MKYKLCILAMILTIKVTAQSLEKYQLKDILEIAQFQIENLNGKTLKFKHEGNYQGVDFNDFRGYEKDKKGLTALYKCTNHNNLYKIVFKQGLEEEYELLCFDLVDFVIIIGYVENYTEAVRGFTIHFKREDENLYIELNGSIYPNSISFEPKNVRLIADLDVNYHPIRMIRVINQKITSHSEIILAINGKVEKVNMIDPKKSPNFSSTLSFCDIMNFLRKFKYEYVLSADSRCYYHYKLPFWVVPYPCFTH